MVIKSTFERTKNVLAHSLGGAFNLTVNVFETSIDLFINSSSLREQNRIQLLEILYVYSKYAPRKKTLTASEDIFHVSASTADRSQIPPWPLQPTCFYLSVQNSERHSIYKGEEWGYNLEMTKAKSYENIWEYNSASSGLNLDHWIDFADVCGCCFDSLRIDVEAAALTEHQRWFAFIDFSSKADSAVWDELVCFSGLSQQTGSDLRPDMPHAVPKVE